MCMKQAQDNRSTSHLKLAACPAGAMHGMLWWAYFIQRGCSSGCGDTKRMIHSCCAAAVLTADRSLACARLLLYVCCHLHHHTPG
jgi:hypothetical protein